MERLFPGFTALSASSASQTTSDVLFPLSYSYAQSNPLSPALLRISLLFDSESDWRLVAACVANWIGELDDARAIEVVRNNREIQVWLGAQSGEAERRANTLLSALVSICEARVITVRYAIVSHVSRLAGTLPAVTSNPSSAVNTPVLSVITPNAPAAIKTTAVVPAKPAARLLRSLSVPEFAMFRIAADAKAVETRRLKPRHSKANSWGSFGSLEEALRSRASSTRTDSWADIDEDDMDVEVEIPDEAIESLMAMSRSTPRNHYDDASDASGQNHNNNHNNHHTQQQQQTQSAPVSSKGKGHIPATAGGNHLFPQSSSQHQNHAHAHEVSPAPKLPSSHSALTVSATTTASNGGAARKAAASQASDSDGDHLDNSSLDHNHNGDGDGSGNNNKDNSNNNNHSGSSSSSTNPQHNRSTPITLIFPATSVSPTIALRRDETVPSYARLPEGVREHDVIVSGKVDETVVLANEGLDLEKKKKKAKSASHRRMLSDPGSLARAANLSRTSNGSDASPSTPNLSHDQDGDSPSLGPSGAPDSGSPAMLHLGGRSGDGGVSASTAAPSAAAGGAADHDHATQPPHHTHHTHFAHIQPSGHGSTRPHLPSTLGTAGARRPSRDQSPGHARNKSESFAYATGSSGVTWPESPVVAPSEQTNATLEEIDNNVTVVLSPLVPAIGAHDDSDPAHVAKTPEMANAERYARAQLSAQSSLSSLTNGSTTTLLAPSATAAHPQNHAAAGMQSLLGGPAQASSENAGKPGARPRNTPPLHPASTAGAQAKGRSSKDLQAKVSDNLNKAAAGNNNKSNDNNNGAAAAPAAAQSSVTLFGPYAGGAGSNTGQSTGNSNNSNSNSKKNASSNSKQPAEQPSSGESKQPVPPVLPPKEWNPAPSEPEKSKEKERGKDKEKEKEKEKEKQVVPPVGTPPPAPQPLGSSASAAPMHPNLDTPKSTIEVARAASQTASLVADAAVAAVVAGDQKKAASPGNTTTGAADGKKKPASAGAKSEPPPAQPPEKESAPKSVTTTVSASKHPVPATSSPLVPKPDRARKEPSTADV
eukprot:comp22465_c0_seq1/m.55420 comp22465_c0_seq1/g.55420  ORF comp22465_c0_seq1/g.55420 comp22465_c0_seq1/m.55420 type:complete len:1051 (-) comp22465_c0_seq1:48-3200(-)